MKMANIHDQRFSMKQLQPSKSDWLGSILQRRLLDPGKRLDYLYLVMLAMLPVLISRWLHIDASFCLEQSRGQCSGADFFQGYWDSYNWTGLIIMLPLGLFLLRWVNRKLFGASTPLDAHDDAIPPILLAFDSKRRAAMQTRLIALSHDGWNFIVVFCLTTGFHIMDLWQIGHDYLGFYFPDMARDCNGLEISWQNFFLAGKCHAFSNPSVDVLSNLALTLAAYPSQFCIVFIAFMAIVLFTRFNLFYLSRIYQRHRASGQDKSDYIVLDFDDIAHSFGFRKLHVTFNIQLLTLIIAGVFVLVSRYGNVAPEDRPDLGELIPQKLKFQELLDLLEKLDISVFFPTTG